MVKPADKPLDRLGREIKVGDYVVHAASYGSSARMNFGRVDSFVTKAEKVRVKHGEYDDNGAWIPPVYDIREYLKVKVQPCEKDGTPTEEAQYIRDHNGIYQKTGTSKPVRTVTIEHLNRLAVITLD
jgi:hypothetical protein